MSDHFDDDSPFYFRLGKFDIKQSSVFQIVRLPGKWFVYFGCFLLLTGLFLMLHIRERRIWLILKEIHLSERLDSNPLKQNFFTVSLFFVHAGNSVNISEEFKDLVKN